MTTFRRFSKRRQRAALVVALLDQLRWGPPEPLGAWTRASQSGFCVACGTWFNVDDAIVLARYGPREDNYQSWIHDQCPYLWDTLANTIEGYDDKIITRINPVGRGRASCGHDVTDRPVYLVRRPVPLDESNHSSWCCEACVTPKVKRRY